VEFIEPGHPEQNGAHEQMHRVYKAETLNPPSASVGGQKRRTQQWCWEYNHQRPHEALGMQCQATITGKAGGDGAAVAEVKYPSGWKAGWSKAMG